MQDLLKILQDKCVHLKALLGDSNKLKNIFNYTSYSKKVNLNEKLEETLAMMVEISKIIMSEFQANMAELGIKKDVLMQKEYQRPSIDEGKTLVQNVELFKYLFEKTFKRCVDCYFIMQRQVDWQPLKDRTVRKLLKYLSKSRYNLCEIYEEFLILHQVVEQKQKWEESNSKINRYK